MASNFKEVKKLYADDVRSLCIEKRFYTKGDNVAYSKLLDWIYDREDNDENVTIDDLEYIARDILEHSDCEYSIETMMYALNQRACTYFVAADN